MIRPAILIVPLAALALSAQPAAPVSDLPFNQWVEVRKDPVGARRGSAIRYAPEAKQFFLWGFMNADPELLQEFPLMEVPEYDMVAFDLAERRWNNHLPKQMEREWSKKLPPAYSPRTYAGITTGSERSVMRGDAEGLQGVPRPDLNMVFDQVTYRPASNSLYYFTGGLSAVYDIARRRWSDLKPFHSPPPVVGGSLAFDPVHDEIVLFGGGHVAEQGPDGSPRGYTGTWVYSIRDNDWRQLSTQLLPPPRMNTRIVSDTKNNVLVMFGGDGQKFYLADTWLFDLSSRAWRQSKASGGPEPRAGHFTVYDPESGLVIIGGGYNRKDLTDMWAYDAVADRWQRLNGTVPAGFYISGDIAPDQRLILLATNTRTPGDRMTCNVLFPVRTTYAYRIDARSMPHPDQTARRHGPMPKRGPDELKGIEPDAARGAAQAERLKNLPVNQWVLLNDPGRIAPTRTWGSATFDSDRGRILSWGGGHCGYGGSDVDEYDVAEHTWFGVEYPEYPERTWNMGVRLAGFTFDGGPWTDHGRRVFAYDPVGKRMIIVPRFRLTTGYEPEWLRSYPTEDKVAPDALVRPPSSYRKAVTLSYDLTTRQWKLVGPEPAGVDALVSTPYGVMGVNVDWPGRLNDAGYHLPWRPTDPPVDNAIFLLRGDKWERLSKSGPAPQNLYELTSLAYDSKRDVIYLHGGGKNRAELWSFDMKTRQWKNLNPKVAAPAGAAPPNCSRESAYIPGEDVLLTYGNSGDVWVYAPVDNAWRKVQIPTSGENLHGKVGQNRAMVYDQKRDVLLLVLGGRGGDVGQASVYAMRYRHGQTALAAAASGPVEGPLVVSDRWPESTDLSTWVRDVMRLEGVEKASETAQGIVLFRWLRLFNRMATGGMIQASEGEYGRERSVMDSHKQLFVYGWGFCDTTSRLAEAVWTEFKKDRSAGERVCVQHDNGGFHTMYRLRMDGKHGAFDPRYGYYLIDRDAPDARIVDWDEVGVDENILKNKTYKHRSGPFFEHFGLEWERALLINPRYFASQRDWEKAGSPVECVFGNAMYKMGTRFHDMNFRLPKGATIERYWDNTARMFYVPASKQATREETFLPSGRFYRVTETMFDGNWIKYDPNYKWYQPYVTTVPAKEGYNSEVAGGRTIGQAWGRMVYEPDLRAAPPEILLPGSGAGTGTLDFYSPYVLVDGALSGELSGSADDGLTVEIRVEQPKTLNASQPDVWSRWDTVHRGPGKFSVALGRQRFNGTDSSIYGAYRFQVRVSAAASAVRSKPAGLSALRVETFFENGIMSIPQIFAGRNSVRFKVRDASRLQGPVRVVYRYQTAQGERRSEHVLQPADFRGNVATYQVDAPGLVRCNSLSISY